MITITLQININKAKRNEWGKQAVEETNMCVQHNDIQVFLIDKFNENVSFLNMWAAKKSPIQNLIVRVSKNLVWKIVLDENLV